MGFYLLIAIIFLLAGFTQGFSGFGAALVAIPLLILVMDVKTAVPLCVLNGLLITSYLTVRLRGHLDWKKISPLLIGALPGIYAGVFFLKNAPEGIIKIMLGVMLIGYGVYRLALNPVPKAIHAGWSYVAGFATGAISAAISAGGPPAIIYTTLSGWEKDEIKATLSGFFLIAGVLIALGHAVSGLTTMSVLRLFAGTALPVLAGVVAGSACYDRLGKEAYIKFLLIMLVLMGFMMIGSAAFSW